MADILSRRGLPSLLAQKHHAPPPESLRPFAAQQRERPHGSMTVLDLSDAGYHGGAIPVHQHQQYPPGGPMWGPQNWDAENAQATRTTSPPYVYTQGELAIQGKSQGTFLPPIDPPRWAGGESGEPLLIQIDGL